MRELRGLQLSLAEIEATGATIVAVSKDAPAELAALKEQDGLGFTLLSDPKLELAREFGVLHPGADPRHPGEELARPAVLLFDRDGTLRAKFLTEDWRERLDGPKLLDLLAKLDAAKE